MHRLTVFLSGLGMSLLLLSLMVSPAAATSFPDETSFDCNWKFLSGQNAGLTGTSTIRFDLGAGDLTRTGRLVTTYPNGTSNDNAVTLNQPRVAAQEKLWRLHVPDGDITCTLHVQKANLVFDSCSNGVYQTCRQQGISAQTKTGPAPLYFFLEELTIFDEREGLSAHPEIEAFQIRIEPCGVGACTCGPGEFFCQNLDTETTLIFDGKQHRDAIGRLVTFPDVNKTGQLYRTDLVLARYDPLQREYAVTLVEDDKDPGRLRLNDCIRLLECTFSIEIGGSGPPGSIKDCPSGTPARAVSCAFGTGDDQFKNPIHLDASLDPGESTVATSREWRIKYRLDHL